MNLSIHGVLTFIGRLMVCRLFHCNHSKISNRKILDLLPRCDLSVAHSNPRYSGSWSWLSQFLIVTYRKRVLDLPCFHVESNNSCRVSWSLETFLFVGSHQWNLHWSWSEFRVTKDMNLELACNTIHDVLTVEPSISARIHFRASTRQEFRPLLEIRTLRVWFSNFNTS